LRVLRLGARKQIALMRPHIPMTPEWRAISRRVRQEEAPPFWQRFHLCQSINGCYKKSNNADILSCDEFEMNSAEKVFLLVSRAMNDKTCLVGKVYRCMMCEFFARMGRVRYMESSPRARRLDCHSIICELARVIYSSSKDTHDFSNDYISMALQSLVFGELYTHVFEEILMEWKEKDDDLRAKSFSLVRKIYYGEESSTSCSRASGAIEALRYLPETVTPVEKIEHCVQFLEYMCNFSTATRRRNASQTSVENIDPDSLFDAICRHILFAVAEGSLNLNAEISFLTEFASNECLLGKGGFAVVVLQSALHYLDACSNVNV